MDSGSPNHNGSAPSGTDATPEKEIKRNQPRRNRVRRHGEAPKTPFGFNRESFESYAVDSDGVKRAGSHMEDAWHSDPANREQIGQSRAEFADCRRRQAAHQRELDRWTDIKRSVRPLRRRAVGEPEFRDPTGRLKLDALKAIVLTGGVTTLVLTEFFGATSLTQAAPWTFINESWGRAALLTFPFVVAGYVQLRNAVKSLRGRHKRALQLGLMVAGVTVAVLGLLCLGVSLGDAHRETESLRPDAPLVPYAALTCLSMLGAALSLVVVESWLQQKIDACRRYVETINPAYERASKQVAHLLDRVGEYDRRAIESQCVLASLTKDRAAWVDWAESEVRRRQHEASEKKSNDDQRRRLVDAKQRAEMELKAFEG